MRTCVVLVMVCALPSAAGCGRKNEAHEVGRTATAEVPSARAPLPPAPPSLRSGLTEAERAQLYHAPVGAETMPLALLRALESSVTRRPFLEELERFGMLHDPHPANIEQLPVGMALQPSDTRHPLAMVGLTCSACHVGELRRGGKAVRIDGAPSAIDVHAFFSEALASVRATLASPEATLAFDGRFRGEAAGTSAAQVEAAVLAATCPGCDAGEIERRVGDEIPWLKPPAPRGDLQSELARSPEGQRSVAQVRRHLRDRVFVLAAYFTHLKRMVGTASPGPGRCDTLAAARDLLARHSASAPPAAISDIPALWGSGGALWAGRAGDIAPPLARDLAFTLGTGAGWNPVTFASSARPSAIVEAETIAGKIETPAWPEEVLGPIDRAQAAHGKSLFAKSCASCHDAAAGDARDAGTEPVRAASLTRKIGERSVAQLLGDELGKLAGPNAPALPDVKWEATGRYRARRLAGVWATAPYLHNGSVPSIYDLLQPAARRPKTFALGSREYDPSKLGFVVAPDPNRPSTSFTFDTEREGNSNAGHEFGTRLSDSDKRDLIEYLKTL